jgi:hypothetical protein
MTRQHTQNTDDEHSDEEEHEEEQEDADNKSVSEASTQQGSLEFTGMIDLPGGEVLWGPVH